MRFRTKIIITYSILILLLVMILAITYTQFSINQYVKTEYENLQTMGEKISRQFEEIIKPMEAIPELLLSNMQVLDAIRLLTILQPNSELNRDYIASAQNIIRLNLNSYYIMKNFYRVVFFNSTGSAISSNNNSDNIIKTNIDISNLDWLPKVEAANGKSILIGCHEDNWGAKKSPEVFSVAKEIQGIPASYIEVQKEASELAGIFSVAGEGVNVIAMMTDGEILYSTKELNKESKDFYVLTAQSLLNSVGEFKNPVNNDTEIISSVYSDYTKLTVLLIKDKGLIRSALSFISYMAMFITLCIIAVSFIYIMIMSELLTKPMRQLREKMEYTELDNLKDEIVFDKSNDEIEALNQTYQKVLNRLDQAIVKEKKTSFLQLQAQFDSLQAQVNPHFLYNVLNVLSSRGLANGDEKICDICYSLATMLRYSTNNKQREASIAEEAQYLEEYFSLLKIRYEHKLEYTIKIDQTIKTQVIPKIVLQQLVENSINHGFETADRPMKIEIKGWEDQGYWYIKVNDNGQGFDRDMLDKLNHKMQETKCRLMEECGNIEMEIGGMGLVNTYARLLLIYCDDLVFSLSNCEQGAQVMIGGIIKETKEA